MKVIPLRKLEIKWSKSFKWWYYDFRTGEAVIVLHEEEKQNWRTIRVLEPMWLLNLHDDDIYELYKSPILYNPEDAKQAQQFQRCVRICFAKKISVGCDYKKMLNIK